MLEMKWCDLCGRGTMERPDGTFPKHCWYCAEPYPKETEGEVPRT